MWINYDLQGRLWGTHPRILCASHLPRPGVFDIYVQPPSSPHAVRGRMVPWRVNEWPVLRRSTQSIASQIVQVLL
jgi:hypothetical protein